MTRGRIFCFFMATLKIITWYSVSVSSWHFVVHDNAPQRGQIPRYTQADLNPNQGLKTASHGSEQTYRGLSRLGSRPPSCEHKCGGCVPCDATQIPATTDRKALQFANYELEGWKCKCGSTFYNP